MRTCDIKNCSSVGLYQARKYVFCEKHKDWATKIIKADHSRYTARREAQRDEDMSLLARQNHMQGTEGKKVRQRIY